MDKFTIVKAHDNPQRNTIIMEALGFLARILTALLGKRIEYNIEDDENHIITGIPPDIITIIKRLFDKIANSKTLYMLKHSEINDLITELLRKDREMKEKIDNIKQNLAFREGAEKDFDDSVNKIYGELALLQLLTLLETKHPDDTNIIVGLIDILKDKIKSVNDILIRRIENPVERVGKVPATGGYQSGGDYYRYKYLKYKSKYNKLVHQNLVNN